MLYFIHVIEIFLIITGGAPEVHALTMEGVRIARDREYLHIQKDTDLLLECTFSAVEDEVVKVVTWYHDNMMAYKWAPPEAPTIGKGLEKGDVVLSRSDGNLEFSKLRSDLAGKYRCEVVTTKGKTYKSSEYQLVIVDMPDVSEKAKALVENCSIYFSWTAPAVSPKPEPICGVWSIAHSYILTAPTFHGTPYYNGSVGYKLEQEVFQINNMPLDSLIRCELRVTKIDDSRIQLLEESYNFTEVWERGCAPLDVQEGVELEYDNERITCHGEIRSKDENAPVIARLKCKEGLMPKYPDFVSSVEVVCENEKWVVANELTWNHFDNLECVRMPKIPDRPPLESTSRDPRTLKDSSAGVKSLLSPWAVLLLLGVTVLTAVICGLHLSHGKKKDPRYLA